MADLSGKLRRTQIMNYSLKKASLVGNALGSIAVSYCAIHTLIGYTDSKSLSLGNTATLDFYLKVLRKRRRPSP